MVIVDELIEAFEIFIKQVTSAFKVPGQIDPEHRFESQIFCSVLGFLGEQSGHIVFEQDRLLTEATIPHMMNSVKSQLNVAFEVIDKKTSSLKF